MSEPDCVTEKNTQCFAKLSGKEVPFIMWDTYKTLGAELPTYRTQHRKCSFRYASTVVMDVLAVNVTKLSGGGQKWVITLRYSLFLQWTNDKNVTLLSNL
jgi:hypothetical protein